MELTEISPKLSFHDQIKPWFDELVTILGIHQISLETNTAPTEREDFYKKLITGKEEDIVSMNRASSSMYFIKSILVDYTTELKSRLKKPPLKLALDYSDEKVLVWAEVEDDDDGTEDALILAEAKVNSKYYTKGFNISSTIVEKSDGLTVPPHYKSIIVDGRS
ncbi:MAG TPA: hypothetical protein VD908_03565 [Cytophagales bacterium]|nr:hypothetical protein [Cytophagales bacterium]